MGAPGNPGGGEASQGQSSPRACRCPRLTGALGRPPAHLRPCQLPTPAPGPLAGGKPVGGGGTGAEQLAQEFLDLGGPSRERVSSRRPRRPVRLLTLGPRAQVLAIELVTTTVREAQLLGHRGDRQTFGTQLRQHVADEGNSVAMAQLTVSFFIWTAWGLCPPKFFAFRPGCWGSPRRQQKRRETDQPHGGVEGRPDSG